MLVYYRHIEDGFCLTFPPDNNSLYIENFESTFYKKWKLIVHEPHTHSHFEIQNRHNLKLFEYYTTRFGVVKVDYLPFPYSTDCIVYSDKQQNKFWLKSRTDCKLEVMKLKELEICGHNYYWR